MSDHIPESLWSKIFKKLTPETLIRCSCVCKSWRFMIYSQFFIDSHLAAQNPNLIVKEGQNYFVPFHPDQTLNQFDLRFQFEHLGFSIIGTVNGVVCLANESLASFGTPNDVVLWNPSIRRCVYPPTSPHFVAAGYTSTLGIGYDNSTRDLKVVRVARIVRGGPFGRSGYIPPRAEVFSVREWSWRKVDYGVVECSPLQNRWAQCMVNGSAHWAAFLRYKGEVVLSFDFNREEFNTIELPSELQRAQAHVSKFGSTMLAMVHFKHETDGFHGFDVWAMREYGEVNSWSKVVSVEAEWGVMRSVVWLREDSEEMIVVTENGEMSRYNARSRVARPLGIRCEGVDGCFADGFVRSLVLLDL